MLCHLRSKTANRKVICLDSVAISHEKSPARPGNEYLENELLFSTLSRATSGYKGGLGGFKGQPFARSRYGPHHGSGLPTRLCVVSSLSLKAAPGRLARPPTAALLNLPYPAIASGVFCCLSTTFERMGCGLLAQIVWPNEHSHMSLRLAPEDYLRPHALCKDPCAKSAAVGEVSSRFLKRRTVPRRINLSGWPCIKLALPTVPLLRSHRLNGNFHRSEQLCTQISCGSSSPPRPSSKAGRKSRKVSIIKVKLASCWPSSSSPPSC